jgi:2-polyprenyl-3-methyl-5-hydroxy-6-metoxy-1,4-benzoquinol methylase
MSIYKVNIALYNKVAEAYEAKFMNNSIYHKSYDALLECMVNKHLSVLDIACGPGNISKYILSKKPECIITGIDAAPNMVSLATKNIPSGLFKVMDCRDVLQLNQMFDVIICGFCMPYITKADVKKLLVDMSAMLNQNGILYMSTMEGVYDSSDFEKASFGGENQIFIHYHEEAYLKEYLAECGLTVEKLIKQNYPESDGSITIDMIFIAKK